MSVFHQIGHNSMNLVNEPDLGQYCGMVCSPLNYTELDIAGQVHSLPKTFKTIFDPQLYFPRSERGHLKEWSYFPNDFESADQSNLGWWSNICDLIIDSCNKMGCNAVCSPCLLPARFTDEYYGFCVEVGNYIHKLANDIGMESYQTAIIDYDSVGELKQPEIISSILSRSNSNNIYLIITSDVEPRRELSDAASLTGIMKTIWLLTQAGMNVFVAFCSSEFVLWKYAGAEMFATGKFFNLRRFTKSRFDEPSGGGGQLPYWFEKNVMAYLREGDLLRLQKANMINPDYMNNPYSVEILNLLQNSPGTAWLALSWKNYLFSFASLDQDISSGKISIKDLLINAEKSWAELDDKNILMEEIKNDGAWIRKWRIAINDLDSYINNM